jgi:hypothetical protein
VEGTLKKKTQPPPRKTEIRTKTESGSKFSFIIIDSQCFCAVPLNADKNSLGVSSFMKTIPCVAPQTGMVVLNKEIPPRQGFYFQILIDLDFTRQAQNGPSNS